MLRLLSTQRFYELCKCCHFVGSGVTKRKPLSLIPVCHHQVSIPRHLNTGSPVWKDALQPKGDESKEMETLDLDKWKSVMRLNVVSGGKQQIADEGDAGDDDDDDEDDETCKEPGGDSSSLEATRKMVEVWRLAGKLVPQEMTDEQVQELAELRSKSAKKRYLKFLAIKENYKKNRKRKQQVKKMAREAELEEKTAQDGDAEEPKNTYVLHFWNRSLEKLQAWRSAQAMQFGHPLLYDLSYDSKMSQQELKNTVHQLMAVEGLNRRATEPFHLHYCNLQPGSAYEKELLQRYGAQTWDSLLITSTDRRHVDLFPHEQLVYLSADSPNVLRTFDHSKIYIIGAMVDKSIQTGLSMANAKRLKLATARLPLTELLQWEMGAKNLTLDQMFCIMMTLKDTGSWEQALKFVPTRKHDGVYKKEVEALITNNQVWRSTNHGPKEDGDRSSRLGERNTGKTFKNVDRSLYRSHSEPKCTGRDRMAGFGRKEAETLMINNRVRGSTHDGPRGNGDKLSKFGERNGGKTFKNVDRSLYRSHTEPTFTGRDRTAGFDRNEEPAVTRVQTSFKSMMEKRKKK